MAYTNRSAILLPPLRPPALRPEPFGMSDKACIPPPYNRESEADETAEPDAEASRTWLLETIPR